MNELIKIMMTSFKIDDINSLAVEKDSIRNIFFDLDLSLFKDTFRYSLLQKNNEYVLICSIPRADKSKFKITKQGIFINISGERKPYDVDKNIVNELYSGSFSRKIELPTDIGKTLKTNYVDGELIINFEKIISNEETISLD